MGQPQAPLSPLSQQLNDAQSAVASALGVATFTFPAPPMGTTFTGTITCPGAPTGAIFTATIGATPWGAWAGNSVFGPVQAFPNQPLVVQAQGLNPNASFEVEWTGSSDPSTLVAAIWPDPNATALFALSSQGSTDLLWTGTFNMAGAPLILNGTALHNYQSFILLLGEPAGPWNSQLTFSLSDVSTGASLFQTSSINFANGCVARLGLPVNGGDTLQLVINSTAGNQMSYRILGTTDPLVVTPNTAPGQPLFTSQEGGLTVIKISEAANGTFPLLGAPPAGYAYRLWSAVTLGSMGFALVGVTSLGVYGYLWPTTNNNQQPTPGQLVTEALEVVTAGVAGASTLTLTYDTVVIPNLAG